MSGTAQLFDSLSKAATFYTGVDTKRPSYRQIVSLPWFQHRIHIPQRPRSELDESSAKVRDHDQNPIHLRVLPEPNWKTNCVKFDVLNAERVTTERTLNTALMNCASSAPGFEPFQVLIVGSSGFVLGRTYM